MTLDDLGGTKEGKAKFNQFDGKKSSYKEEFYTSKLDESKITQEQKQKAQKVEKEINSLQSLNKHQLEDRGIVKIDGQDDVDERANENEEMMYSGVYRKQKEQ